MKYHILFMKKVMMKVTSAKDNCIVKIKIMNEIQRIIIHWNYVVLVFIIIKYAWDNWITK